MLSERVREIRRAYKTIPRTGLHISPRAACVYVPNQKAGCSSFKLLLQRLERDDPDYNPERVHGDSTLPRIRNYGWGCLDDLLAKGILFTFVRHPLDRIVSAYRDKIVKAHQKYGPDIHEALGLAYDEDTPLPFDAFLEYVEGQDPVDLDQHWRPQRINTMFDSVRYDLIGRLEALDQDVARLRDMLGLEELPLPHRNDRSDIDLDNPFEGRPDRRRRVKELYEQDFEAFGYY